MTDQINVVHDLLKYKVTMAIQRRKTFFSVSRMKSIVKKVSCAIKLPTIIQKKRQRKIGSKSMYGFIFYIVGK